MNNTKSRIVQIGIISDIHYPTRLQAYPNFSALLKTVDSIIGCGDFVTHTVIEDLMLCGKPCYFVKGNMDDHVIQLRYPEKIQLQLEKFTIGVIHGYGTPFNIQKRIAGNFTDRMDIIIYGHTHEYFNNKIDLTLFINPGAFCSGDYVVVYIEKKHIEVEKKRWN